MKEGLKEAIETVMVSAQGSKARQYAKDFGLTIDDRMAVIVQRMAYGGEDGVIYSKFPASASITKIISWRYHDEEERFFTILRRNDASEGLHTAGEVIEGGGIDIEIADRLAGISYAVEGNFGFPVRIEYTMARHPEEIYLLQARSIAGIKNIKNITVPELNEGNLLLGTYETNGATVDYVLPVVMIPDPFIFHEAEEMDRKFPNGYALVGEDLPTLLTLLEHDTPNKKAILAETARGCSHGLDRARQKDVIYLVAKGVGKLFTGYSDSPPLETGDLVRIVSDGTRGLVYKVDG